MKEFPLDKVFQFLEPGPVVLLSTARDGKANVMTMSWHMVMEFTPQFGCVVSPANHSFAALRETGECVIAVPAVDLIGAVADIGNCSGRDVDKLQAFGLTPLAAAKVEAPLIAECLANLECRVVDASLADTYCLFVLECVQAWIEPDRTERRTFHANGDGTFVVDGQTLDLKKQMVKWPEFI
jgi:flavin reductase (DIM6/NTAB) family NADH-FMN oxidoreductase RutF